MAAGVVVRENIVKDFAAYVAEAPINIRERRWKLRLEGGEMGRSTNKKN